MYKYDESKSIPSKIHQKNKSNINKSVQVNLCEYTHVIR